MAYSVRRVGRDRAIQSADSEAQRGERGRVSEAGDGQTRVRVCERAPRCACACPNARGRVCQRMRVRVCRHMRTRACACAQACVYRLREEGGLLLWRERRRPVERERRDERVQQPRGRRVAARVGLHSPGLAAVADHDRVQQQRQVRQQQRSALVRQLAEHLEERVLRRGEGLRHRWPPRTPREPRERCERRGGEHGKRARCDAGAAVR
eukprot:5074927-Pleurochrysis_carterae.AAC.2